ncbi:MAG: VWA domain-containing protein [Acidobacteriota bacterium]|nr:VWA domain-containing protein [Acidobacteriota bacterium]
MKTKRRSHLFSLAPAIALLQLLTPLTRVAEAQNRGQNIPQRTFAEAIEVRVVNLEAVVVDKHGKRVTGLAPDDFTLEVDGKQTTIEYFSEISLGRALETVQPATGEPARATPAGIEPGSPVGTSFLLFIDSYFTRRATQRNHILERIEESLQRLGAEDRMAIVAFDGRRIDVLESWAPPGPKLSRALARARELPARGFITDQLAGELDRESALETAISAAAAEQEAFGGDGGDSANVPDTAVAVREDGQPADICVSIKRLEHRLERAVLGVASTLRSFARPPGRKIMMILSGGWPQSAKDYLVGTMTPFAARDCPDEGPRLYEPIYSTANLLGYTLYPIDIPPPAHSSVNAAASGAELFANAENTTAPVGGEVQFVRQHETHATLLTLADQTGGEAMIDAANLSAFDRVVEDTRSYYWLGFTPVWKGDNKNHKIKLKVPKPGLEVRTRASFQDLSRQKEVSFVTESALLFGDLPGSTPLGLELGPLPKKGRGRLTLPVQLSIPMDEITMLPDGQRYVAQLELRIGVLDEDGNRNDMPVIPVMLDGPEPPPGAHALYETAIKIRRAPHDIVISLYDPLGDTILAATGEFRP